MDEVTAAGGEAIAAPADVCRSDDVEALRDRVASELGPVTVLIPFAGGFSAYTPVHLTIDSFFWTAILAAIIISLVSLVAGLVPGSRR